MEINDSFKTNSGMMSESGSSRGQLEEEFAADTPIGEQFRVVSLGEFSEDKTQQAPKQIVLKFDKLQKIPGRIETAAEVEVKLPITDKEEKLGRVEMLDTVEKETVEQQQTLHSESESMDCTADNMQPHDRPVVDSLLDEDSVVLSAPHEVLPSDVAVQKLVLDDKALKESARSGTDKFMTSKDIQVVKMSKIPEHIAIIMDGNGRWAESYGLRREEGHTKGLEVVERIIQAYLANDIKYLTLYTFSSDNWNRPCSEVSNIMSLIGKFFLETSKNLISKGVKFVFIGDRSRLDPELQELLLINESSSEHSKCQVIVAINYSARNEIRNASLKMCRYVISNQIKPNMIASNLFDNFIDSNIPNPDLLIRTGGEKRVSDFLLWQIAYTELYFSDVLWPDFSEADLTDAIKDFSSRHRRFGKTN